MQQQQPDFSNWLFERLEKLQRNGTNALNLFLLSAQETWEDLKGPGSLHEKRRVVRSFGYRNRVVLCGALFVFTALMQTLQEIQITRQYSSSSVGENGRLLGKETASFARMDGVVQIAVNHVEPKSNITVAACYKTMFGDIDLGLVLQWVAYNRLLGFDHIFMFYRPEIMKDSRFEELNNLPFVTLTEQTGGKRKNYYNQWQTENMCLQNQELAASYDWVLIADIDEYLWFSEPMSVKEYLQTKSNMTYLSFGKQMYTLDHRSDMAAVDYKIDSNSAPDTFAVSNYPFYLNHFCYHKNRRGNPICPTWRGRSKVIVRPKYHNHVDVHGYIFHPNPENGSIHLHPNEAHFMEWPHLFGKHNVTQQKPQNFTIQSGAEVHIHDLKNAFNPDENGKYLVQYDSKLKDWFNFVMSRGAASSTK